MTPAIVSIHYHLRPGGVTEVIRQNHRILNAAGIPHTIVCGDNPSELPAIVDPALDYSVGPPASAGTIPFPPESSALLHFHNPCLGKNPALTRSLANLAESGHALLLQHHDLAEDGRPDMLAALEAVDNPYPDSPRIGHAFINSRDREIFLRAGLAEDRAFLLPNPSSSLHLPAVQPDGPAIVVHPMRGLPRKNLGELLLLAACAPPGTRFIQGSSPANPAWRSHYDEWRRFSETHGLPVEFDGFQHGRDKTLGSSTHLLTTSTKEGFGMIHLEAANQRRVLGRRIPCLDQDLAGFPDDGLYDAILVDGSYFANLPVDAQREAISKTIAGTTVPHVLRAGKPAPLSPWLADQLARRQPGDASEALARHGDSAHLHRLVTIATALLASPQGPVGTLDRHFIASAFASHG